MSVEVADPFYGRTWFEGTPFEFQTTWRTAMNSIGVGAIGNLTLSQIEYLLVATAFFSGVGAIFKEIIYNHEKIPWGGFKDWMWSKFPWFMERMDHLDQEGIIGFLVSIREGDAHWLQEAYEKSRFPAVPVEGVFGAQTCEALSGLNMNSMADVAYLKSNFTLDDVRRCYGTRGIGQPFITAFTSALPEEYESRDLMRLGIEGKIDTDYKAQMAGYPDLAAYQAYIAFKKAQYKEGLAEEGDVLNACQVDPYSRECFELKEQWERWELESDVFSPDTMEDETGDLEDEVYPLTYSGMFEYLAGEGLLGEYRFHDEALPDVIRYNSSEDYEDTSSRGEFFESYDMNENNGVGELSYYNRGRGRQKFWRKGNYLCSNRPFRGAFRSKFGNYWCRRSRRRYNNYRGRRWY